MKTKTIILTTLFVLSGLCSAYAADDKPIDVSQLPQKAQKFIDKHFHGAKVSHATVDNDLLDKSYEVYFADGTKVEFDKQGEWKEVDCRRGRVPDSVVPAQIRDFIAQKHPGMHTVDIERDKMGYEVKLNNGMELKFDRKYRFMRYDD